MTQNMIRSGKAYQGIGAQKYPLVSIGCHTEPAIFFVTIKVSIPRHANAVKEGKKAVLLMRVRVVRLWHMLILRLLVSFSRWNAVRRALVPPERLRLI